jgi:hypothetical protein
MKLKTRLRLVVGITVLLVVIVWASRIPTVRSVASILAWGIRGRTGPLYSVLPNGRVLRSYYMNGKREGTWTISDKDGHVLAESQYRNGEPWSGTCWIYDNKTWIGEYKDGLPWHGCLPRYNQPEQRLDWKYFIRGKEVDYAEFCEEWGLKGTGHIFVGLAYVGVDRGPTPRSPK